MGDTLLLFCYSLGLLCANALAFRCARFSSKWDCFLWVPLAAGLCDLMENALQNRAVWNYQLHRPVGQEGVLSSQAAIAKLCFFVPSMCFPAVVLLCGCCRPGSESEEELSDEQE